MSHRGRSPTTAPPALGLSRMHESLAFDSSRARLDRDTVPSATRHLTHWPSVCARRRAHILCTFYVCTTTTMDKIQRSLNLISRLHAQTSAQTSHGPKKPATRINKKNGHPCFEKKDEQGRLRLTASRTGFDELIFGTGTMWVQYPAASTR